MSTNRRLFSAFLNDSSASSTDHSLRSSSSDLEPSSSDRLNVSSSDVDFTSATSHSVASSNSEDANDGHTHTIKDAVANLDSNLEGARIRTVVLGVMAEQAMQSGDLLSGIVANIKTSLSVQEEKKLSGYKAVSDNVAAKHGARLFADSQAKVNKSEVEAAATNTSSRSSR